jgi:hypothetical protein
MTCARLQVFPYCEAYPGPDEAGAIPMPIILNQVDHRKPYKGDHGLQYKPKDGDKAKPA